MPYVQFRNRHSVRLAACRPMHLEEAWLSGTAGSGGVFLSGCNHACVFCQNHEINHGNSGIRRVSPEDLATRFLELQALGCHNLH